MAAQNRHLRGAREEVLADIHGNTVVEAGDFMFRNAVAGSVGSGTVGDGIAADNYAFPFNKAINAASVLTGIQYCIYSNFLGVAMESSKSGVTEKISIAKAGVFRYPLYGKSAVTVGALVSAVSAYDSAQGVSAQCVHQAATAPGSTAYLGYIVKTESGASFVDFQIRTAFGSAGLAT
jgi:hypothetical protein